MSGLVFRALLALYPPRVRSLFREEMLSYMRAGLDRARVEHRVLRYWARLLADTARAVPASWWGRGGEAPRFGDRDSVVRSFLGELRLATRSLARRPGFTVAVVATLALGIGASTAVFTIVHGVLLAPLPYPEADRVVALHQANAGGMQWSLSVADFQAIHEQQRSFVATAAFTERDVIVAADGEPEWSRAAFVTADYFRVLGVSPASGRDFGAGDDVVGAESVVILGHALAERLGGAERVVGSTIAIDSNAHTVVGVMPEGVAGVGGRRSDLWPIMQLEPPGRRGPFYLVGLGRLRADRTLADARADLEGISERIFPIWQEGFRDETARLTPAPLQEYLVGRVRGGLAMIFGAVLLVLLVSVGNVANLLLGRASERQTEMALRTAIGAGTGRLARWLLAESLVLALAGAALGLGLAAAALEAFRGFDTTLPRAAELGLGGTTVLFAIGVALATALTLGLVPLFAHAGLDLSRSLREGGRSALAGGRAGAVRSGLIVLEMALTVPLLLSAGLLLGSLLSMQRVDPGYDPAGAFAIRISLPTGSYSEPQEFARFWDRAIADVSEVPGVEAAGASMILPPDSFGFVNNFDLVDDPVDPGQPEPNVPWALISGPFLEALGVPLLEGRTFTRDDFEPDAPYAIVVSASWAQRYYPGESAIGRQVYSGGDRENPATVVGVVGDVKFAGMTGSSEAVYEPGGGGWLRSMNLLVRTRGDLAGTMAAVRERIRAIDPGLPLTQVQTLQERIDDNVAGPRGWTMLLLAFAAAATLLSAVGIFGVVAHAVRGQTREIGLRIALGARPRGVVAWVVRRAMSRVALGIALGLGLAAVSVRWLQGTLFGVSAADPRYALAVCALLGLIAWLACWLPGRRAARVDPIAALSSD